MQFSVSGRVSKDVSMDVGKLSILFEREIAKVLSTAKIDSPISAIVVFPTILDSSIATMPDFTTHRRDRAVYVGLNIDHTAWSTSNWTEKIALLADNIKRSVARIREGYLSVSDRVTVLRAIDDATSKLMRPSLN